MLRPLCVAALTLAITLMADLKVSTTCRSVRTTVRSRTSVVVPTFGSAVDAASELPRLHSLLVAQRGEIDSRALLQRPARDDPGKRQIRFQERHLRAGRHRRRSQAALARRAIAKYFPDLPEPKRAHHHRTVADDAVGARVDEQSQLRRVGAELELGAARAGEAAPGARRARR